MGRGEGDEVTDEADGEENVRVPFNLVAISEVGQEEGNGDSSSRHSELVQKGESAGKERRLCCVRILPQPSEELQHGKEGSGPVEEGDLPCPFIVKEQTQDTFMSTGHKQATH